MGKIKNLVAAITLMAFGAGAAFAQPAYENLFSLRSSDKTNSTELFVKNPATATQAEHNFEFEDLGRDGTLDEVVEYSAIVPIDYTKDQISQSQKNFFNTATDKYVKDETENFMKILKENPNALKFYQPFGEGKGMAVLEYDGVERAVSESLTNGKTILSFYVGVPEAKWNNNEKDYINIQNLGQGQLYDDVKSLVGDITAEKDKMAEAELSGLLALL